MGGGDLLLEFLGTGQLVQAGDEQILVQKGVSGGGVLLHFAAEELELDGELVPHFVLPLFGQGAWRHNQHPLCVRAHEQLLDEKPCHDRLARSWIIRQHKAQRLLGQHGLIDGGELVREWLDGGGMDCHHGIEGEAHLDAHGLQRQLEVPAGGIKGPGQTGLRQRQGGLILPVEHPLLKGAIRQLVDNRHGILAHHLGHADRGDGIRNEPPELGTALDILQF